MKDQAKSILVVDMMNATTVPSFSASSLVFRSHTTAPLVVPHYLACIVHV